MRKVPKPTTSKTSSWSRTMVIKHGISGHVADQTKGK